MVTVLNKLLRTCYDSQHGYKLAAEHLSGSILSRTLTDYSAQRGRSASELVDEIIKYCGLPVQPDDLVQNVKRGWANLTDALSRKDEKAIIEECRKGDEHAMEQYESILTENLPPITKSLLLKHYEGMRQSVNRLKVLKKPAES